MGDVIDDITDVVEDAIDWVGDTISDVGDWVVDELVDPVVDAVDDVIDAVEDDPIKAIATVAAYATGNAWAIPIIEGVDVAQNGGDIGDILEASAKAYVAQQAGSYAGKYAGEAAVAAGTGETAATILGTASGQAASAAVLGQDPVQAFITGGLKASIEAGLGYIDEKVTAVVDDATGTGDTGTGTGDTGTGTGTGDTGIGAIDDAKSFLEEYPTVKNVLADSLEAALTGKEITGDLIMGAVTKGKITKELVQEYLTTGNFDPTDPADQRYLAALTTTTQNVVNATFSGADVSDTFYASANAYGKQELIRIVDKEVKNTIDKVTGDYQKVEATATQLDKENASYTKIAQSYNSYVAELDRRIGIRDGKLAEVNRLREVLKNTRLDTAADRPAYQAALDNYNNAVNDFNAYSNEVDTYYENRFKPDTNALKIQLDRKADDIAALTTQYDTQKNDLVSTGDQLDDELVPVANAVQNTLVRAMTGDEFNAAEYRAVNDLGDISDDDARYHWLTTGKDENLPVNAAQYQKELDTALTSSMQGTLEALGLDITDLSPRQLQFLRDQTLSYGDGNLQSVRDIENGSSLLAENLQAKIAGFDPTTTVGSLSADAQQEIYDLYGVTSFDQLPKNVRDGYVSQGLEINEKQNIVVPENVSAADIFTNKAVVRTNAEGLLEWGKIDVIVPVPKWSSEYGTVVSEVERYNGSYYEKKITSATGEVLADISGYVDENGFIFAPQTYFDVNNPERSKRFAESGQVEDDGSPLKITLFPTEVDISHLKDNNPGQYLDILAEATPDEVKAAVNAGVTGLQQQYEFAKNVATYIANTEAAKNIANSDFGQNVAGVGLDAGGEFLDAFNNVVYLAGIDPGTTPAGRVAQDMLALAGDFKTAEYQEASARIQDTIKNANREPDTLPDGTPNPKAGQLLTNPDGTQLSTAHKAWNTIKAIGSAAWTDPGVFASEYVAKEVLQEIPILVASGGTANVVKASLKQAGKEFAEEMGRRGALGTAVVLDVSESFGGTAGGAYDDALNEALNSGMDLATAQEYALDKAITSGVLAVVTNVGSMKLGGNKFEKAIFNGRKGKNFSEAFDVVVKEAGQEALEEGIPQAYLESQLYQLNPDRDVVGNVVGNSVLGAISGGGTSGSIYGGAATGDFLSNAIIAFNSNVRDVISNAPDLGAAGVTQQLNDLGLTNNLIQTNILNQAFDADYTSIGEAEQAAFDYVTNSNIPYKFTKNEITDFTGANPDSGLASALDAYVDPRYFDAREVKAAAALEGYALTDEQIQQYVGQMDQQSAVADVREEYDPLAVTADEASQFFTDLGYTPSQDEINQFIAQISETEQQQAVGEYVDPRMVSVEEATNFFDALGYEPTDEEIQQFVGQFGEEQQQAVIDKYVDPRQVTEEEVLNAFKVAGLPDVRPEDIPPLAGQYNEADLVGKLQEALPNAQFNVLKYMLGKPPSADTEATGIYAQLEALQETGLDQDQALEQVISGLQGTEQSVAGIATEINAIADVIGKPATEVTDVDVDFIADIIAQAEVSGDPSTFDFTQAQLAYDVTGDGIVDINDQNLLNDALQGQDVTFATESKFQPATGIFAQLDQQAALQQQQQADLQAQIQAQFDAQAQQQLDQQTQIAQQVEDEAEKTRRLGNLRDLQGMLLEEAGRTTTVLPSKPAQIGAAYDFGSIFRDAGQESFYKSPYAQGGMIETNEELLRLIGGK